MNCIESTLLSNVIAGHVIGVICFIVPVRHNVIGLRLTTRDWTTWETSPRGQHWQWYQKRGQADRRWSVHWRIKVKKDARFSWHRHASNAWKNSTRQKVFEEEMNTHWAKSKKAEAESRSSIRTRRHWRTRLRVFHSTDGPEDSCNANFNLNKLENCGAN